MRPDPDLLDKIERLSPEEHDQLRAFVDSLLSGLARAEAGARPSLKELLLADQPRSEVFAQRHPAPELTHRELVSFD